MMSNRKTALIAILVFVLIVVVGGVYLALHSASAQTVKTGDTVEVNYVGTFPNGTVFSSNQGQQPIQFTVGSGQMIQGFNNAVIGMKVNQTKTVTLPPSEAYGSENPALIEHVPIGVFGNQSVQVGMVATENTSGQVYQGTITQVNATNVTVNFNSPLAGQTLVFKITVVGIQGA